MAKDSQTLERLYIELGLDLSKLQTDIIAAARTVTDNLGRLIAKEIRFGSAWRLIFQASTA